MKSRASSVTFARRIARLVARFSQVLLCLSVGTVPIEQVVFVENTKSPIGAWKCLSEIQKSSSTSLRTRDIGWRSRELIRRSSRTTTLPSVFLLISIQTFVPRTNAFSPELIHQASPRRSLTIGKIDNRQN